MRELSEQNHYEVLELARDCDRAEIEHAYATLSRAYAKESLAGLPLFDAGELADLRLRIKEAFRVLSDAELRRAYDEQLRMAPRASAPAAPVRPAPPAPVFVEASELDGPGLRRLRRARGLELADIESITKIRLRHLRNIEEERFAELPARVYVRGFLEAYANCVGVDPALAANAYLRRFDEQRSKPARWFSKGG